MKKLQTIMEQISGNSVRFDKILQEIIEFGQSFNNPVIWYIGHGINIASEENGYFNSGGVGFEGLAPLVAAHGKKHDNAIQTEICKVKEESNLLIEFGEDYGQEATQEEIDLRYHELLLSKVRNTLSYNPNQEDYGFPISFQSRLEKNYSRFDHDEKNKPKQSATITLGVSSSNRQEQKILIRKVLQYLNRVHKIPQENMSKPGLYRIEPEITLTLYNTKDMALEERIAAFDEKIEFIKSCLDKGGQFCLTKYYGK